MCVSAICNHFVCSAAPLFAQHMVATRCRFISVLLSHCSHARDHTHAHSYTRPTINAVHVLRANKFWNKIWRILVPLCARMIVKVFMCVRLNVICTAYCGPNPFDRGGRAFYVQSCVVETCIHASVRNTSGIIILSTFTSHHSRLNQSSLSIVRFHHKKRVFL